MFSHSFLKHEGMLTGRAARHVSCVSDLSLAVSCLAACEAVWYEPDCTSTCRDQQLHQAMADCQGLQVSWYKLLRTHATAGACHKPTAAHAPLLISVLLLFRQILTR